MSRPFLTARWSNLCLVSYLVPRALLQPRLAPGLELDAPPGISPGLAPVSLVAFDFLDTRVLGVRWPGHVNFHEINLRFYVRRTSDGGRGVMFVREYVVSRLICLVASAVYNEPYAPAARMTCVTIRTPSAISVEHRMTVRSAGTCRLKVTAAAPPVVPPETSVEHWFKEHQWGFGRSRSGALLTYEVRHPHWAVYPETRLDLEFDWAGAYGPEWSLLHDARPVSVVLAEGSPVEVHPKRRLEGVAASASQSPPAMHAPAGQQGG
jgi:uncharacterized protein YqjF (DUF2071 family)